MSYEGYEQYLCKNGHYSQADCYVGCDECPICKEPIVWQNPVDETNCDSIGYIDMSQFLLVPATFKTCDMNHPHKITEDIYRIPNEEETKKAREQ